MIWIRIAKIVLMKRDSQDLLEEFEKVATYGGNGSSNCIRIFKRRAEKKVSLLNYLQLRFVFFPHNLDCSYVVP